MDLNLFFISIPFKVEWISYFFFCLAGVIHIGFFVLESILFQRPEGYKLFKMNEADHRAVKPWAFNQGFYNLFLAIGLFVGLSYVLKLQIQMAGVITSLFGFAMVGAGLVLYFSVPRLRKGALLQMIPPLLGFFFLLFHIIPALRAARG